MAHRPAIKLVFVAAALYALIQLQIMVGDIERLDARLQTLSVMSRQFDETNRSLRLTNNLLAETNAKLEATNNKLNSTNASLRQTRSDIKALSSIRGDIHEMAHKLSGSFLFRGVK